MTGKPRCGSAWLGVGVGWHYSNHSRLEVSGLWYSRSIPVCAYVDVECVCSQQFGESQSVCRSGGFIKCILVTVLGNDRRFPFGRGSFRRTRRNAGIARSSNFTLCPFPSESRVSRQSGVPSFLTGSIDSSYPLDTYRGNPQIALFVAVGYDAP